MVGVIDAGSNDHAIKFSIYFGIDFNNPDDNYIFGSVNKFTLSQIFKAFKLGKPKVPRVVAESGFPEGLTVSYSMKGEFVFNFCNISNFNIHLLLLKSRCYADWSVSGMKARICQV